MGDHPDLMARRLPDSEFDRVSDIYPSKPSPLVPAPLLVPPPPPPAEVIVEKVETEPALPVLPAPLLVPAPAPIVTGYEPGEAETVKPAGAFKGEAEYGSPEFFPSRKPPAPPPPPPPPTPPPPVPPEPPPPTTT